MTKVQYSSVWLGQAWLESSLSYGTRAMVVSWICGFSKTKMTQLMTASKEMVGIAKSQPIKNQSQCLHLPENYLTTGGKAGMASNLPTLSSSSRSATDYHNIFCRWMIIEIIMCLTVSTIVMQSLIMALEISHVQRNYWHRIWVKCCLLSLLRAYWTQADQSAPQAKWHTIVA